MRFPTGFWLLLLLPGLHLRR
ncbi:MAG: GlyGly-CTERM sorting domain-containing protein [Opitutaceae bacterium]|nr:GlyGly-CTERM sorting domain-containing protein [Opitutaceae bacterium]